MAGARTSSFAAWFRPKSHAPAHLPDILSLPIGQDPTRPSSTAIQPSRLLPSPLVQRVLERFPQQAAGGFNQRHVAPGSRDAARDEAALPQAAGWIDCGRWAQGAATGVARLSMEGSQARIAVTLQLPTSWFLFVHCTLTQAYLDPAAHLGMRAAHARTRRTDAALSSQPPPAARVSQPSHQQLPAGCPPQASCLRLCHLPRLPRCSTAAAGQCKPAAGPDTARGLRSMLLPAVGAQWGRNGEVSKKTAQHKPQRVQH